MRYFMQEYMTTASNGVPDNDDSGWEKRYNACQKLGIVSVVTVLIKAGEFQGLLKNSFRDSGVYYVVHSDLMKYAVEKRMGS